MGAAFQKEANLSWFAAPTKSWHANREIPVGGSPMAFRSRSCWWRNPQVEFVRRRLWQPIRRLSARNATSLKTFVPARSTARSARASTTSGCVPTAFTTARTAAKRATWHWPTNDNRARPATYDQRPCGP